LVWGRIHKYRVNHQKKGEEARSMKIVYVSREFGPITGGGIGTYIANVTRYMVQRGHQVYLITDCFNDSNLHYLPTGVTLVPTELTLPDRQGCYFTCFQEYSDRVYQTLKKLSQKTKLDVVEFCEYGAEGFITIRAKKLLNEFAETKLIVKMHTPKSILRDINEEKYKNYQTEIDIYAEDYSVKNADIVTSPSFSLGNYYKDRLKINTITRSPYPLELHTKTNHSRLFTDKQICRIIFIGTLQPRKGVDFFIEAAKLVLAKEPNFQFEIYGKDTECGLFGQSYTECLLKHTPEQIKTNICFKGAVPYEQISDILLDSCFAVFPSRWENWPNVCLEAMSLGCVVIGSKHGGMSEMIEHGVSGFLVDPYKPEEIAYIILDNYKNLSYLQQISESAQANIKQWCDPDLACQQIESCYQREVTPRNWKISQKPKVSVIIPLYNQGQYVQEAIDSVKESTYKNVEIVVINDGSTDEYTNYIFDKLTGVVKVNKPNGGLSSARNAGVRASSGDFILPLDADDKIHSSYIENAVNALINNPELAYVSCYTRNFQAFNSAYIPIGFVPNLMLVMNTDGKCTNLYRKEVVLNVKGFDEKMISYEDWDFLISLYEHGFSGDVLPMEMLYYRRSYSSMVYTVANPKRIELTQYMLFKHSKLLNTYAPLMTQYLVELWKQREMECEWLHNQNHLYYQNSQTADALAQQFKDRITAMESSKFWKFRKSWIKLKRKLGLTQEEP
jgi:glycosyltransferase involved in cell wall biosynthesis